MTFFQPLSRRIGNGWGGSRRMSFMTVSSSTRYIPSVYPKEIQAMALRMSASQHLTSSQRFLSSKPAAEVASAEIATPTSRQLRIFALRAGIPVRKIIRKLKSSSYLYCTAQQYFPMIFLDGWLRDDGQSRHDSGGRGDRRLIWRYI
jgi:hypothetical protein